MLKHSVRFIFSLSLIFSSPIFAEALRPTADARQTWWNIKSQFPNLASNGFFDTPVIELVRVPYEAQVRKAANSNATLTALRPKLIALQTQEASFTAAQLIRSGARRLSLKVQPEKYKAVLAAIENLGLTHLKPEDVYIVEVNSEGQVNAAMYTGSSTGKMVMILFDANHVLMSRAQEQSVDGHEATHFIADQMSTDMEVMFTFQLIGEELFSRRRNAKLSALDKKIEELNRLRQEKPREQLKIRLLALEIQKTKDKIHEEYRRNIAKLEKSLHNRLFDSRFRNPPRNEEEREKFRQLLGFKESEDSYFAIAYDEQKRALQNEVAKQGGAIKALGDVFVALGDGAKEQAELKSSLSKGGDPNAYIDLVQKLNDRFSRACETTADRGGLISVTREISAYRSDYNLYTGRPYRGKDPASQDEIDQFVTDNRQAISTLRGIPEVYQQSQDFLQGGHPYGGDRIAANQAFTSTEEFGIAKDPLSRLVYVYMTRKRELGENATPDEQKALTHMKTEIDRLVEKYKSHGLPVERTPFLARVLKGEQSTFERLATNDHAAKRISDRTIDMVRDRDRDEARRPKKESKAPKIRF